MRETKGRGREWEGGRGGFRQETEELAGLFCAVIMCERGEDRRIPRVIKFCHNREIEDWLFFKDDRPVVLPKNARSSHALTYVSNIKGPLTDSVLQPFSILNTVEWEESSYMLGSATGFRAGDARFFFPGERVELTGRRMAIDFSTDMPVLWETQFFTNNHVVISWQMHTQYGEARRITEVFDLDEPEVLKYRSLFHETRACDFCTARNDLCDCAQTLRDRCFQHLPLEWKASRSQPGDASLQQFNNFASIFFHGKRGALWKFTIEGLIGDTLKTISSNDWNVDYYYSTNGLELESLHSSFLQARIFTLQSPRKRAIEKRYEYDEDEVGNEGMVKEERNIMVSSAFLEGDRPGESSPSLGEDGFRVEKGKVSCFGNHIRNRLSSLPTTNCISGPFPFLEPEIEPLLLSCL